MNRDEIIRGQKVDPSQRRIGGWVGGHGRHSVMSRSCWVWTSQLTFSQTDTPKYSTLMLFSIIKVSLLLVHRLHLINVRPPRSVPDVSIVADFPGCGGDLQGGASCSSCTRSDRGGVTRLNKEKVGVALILPSQACQQQTAWRLPVPTRATSDKSNLCKAGRARQGRGKSLQDVLQQNLPQSLTRCESGGATSLNL